MRDIEQWLPFEDLKLKGILLLKQIPYDWGEISQYLKNLGVFRSPY